MRSRIASNAKLATSDEPPYETNGNVMPVSGITRNTPPRIKNVCKAMIVAIPAANNFANGRAASIAMRYALPIRSMNAATTPIVPTSPSSSPIAAKMKSVAASGTIPGWPSPRPVPPIPPEPSAYQPWIGCMPFPSGSFQGSLQFVTRTRTCPNALYATYAPIASSSSDPTTYATRLVVM